MIKTARTLFSAFIILGFTGAMNVAFAHCDTMEGPVVRSAQVALAKGNITPLLKWVKPSEEQNLIQSFKKTLKVRGKSSEAKKLADRYFYETLVRIHRVGEGAPYTGLKPSSSIDPAVVMADKALSSDSVDKLVKVLTKALENGIRERFTKTLKSQKNVESSVANGRLYVNDYVKFTHYVEGAHKLITGGVAH